MVAGCIDLPRQLTSPLHALSNTFHDSIKPRSHNPEDYSPAIEVGAFPAQRPHLAVNPAARIPPELFDRILSYVNLHCPRSEESKRSGANRTLRRWLAKDDVEDVTRDLKACSLVCLHWALKCRVYVFHRVTLAISSPEDAQVLVGYATTGCPSLAPVHKLAWRITVVQDYHAAYPFCYHLHLLHPLTDRSFFYQLRLRGPVPERFPPNKLGSPHWNIPPSIVTPPSLLPYMHIHVETLRFPSFSHVIKYIRHLTCASHSVFFSRLTWDNGVRETDPLPRSRWPLPTTRPQRNRVEAVKFAEACTDNFRLCLYMAMAQPQCVLRMLPDNELKQAVSLMASLCELYAAKDISARQCGLRWYSQPLENLTEIGLTLIPKDGGVVRSDCRFILGDPLPAAPTTRMQSLVAFRAVFTKDDIHIDLGTLLNLLASHPTLRIVHFDFFDDYEHLRRSMHENTQLLHPQLGESAFILTCQRSKYHPFSEVPIDSDGEYDSIGIDYLTLSPTGQSWRDWSYVVPSLLESSNIG